MWSQNTSEINPHTAAWGAGRAPAAFPGDSGPRAQAASGPSSSASCASGRIVWKNSPSLWKGLLWLSHWREACQFLSDTYTHAPRLDHLPTGMHSNADGNQRELAQSGLCGESGSPGSDFPDLRGAERAGRVGSLRGAGGWPWAPGSRASWGWSSPPPAAAPTRRGGEAAGLEMARKTG